MAKVVIAGAGTLGDHIPLVGLGRLLARRGHTVVLAVNAAMRHLAERAGLDVAVIGDVLGPEEARDAAIDWDHWTVPPADVWRWTTESDNRLIDAALALIPVCHDADLLIVTANNVAGQIVHECIGIPWATIGLTPAMLLAHLNTQDAPRDDEATMHPFERSYAEHLRRVRQWLGLEDRPLIRQPQGGISARLILASTRSMAGDIGERVPPASLTGFCLPDDAAWEGWEPDDTLRAFIDVTPRPLALSFSSLPLTDPAAVLAVHARAAALLGRRLVVLRGWAGFAPEHVPPDVRHESVYFADALPHDWLFSHVDAAFMHGGIGSLARAIRAGCPVVVEPYGNDQFFNARQVLLLGLGAAMHPHRVTPAGLARVLAEKVLTPECRSSVEAVGREIAAEDGLERAATLVSRWLAEVPPWDRSAVSRYAVLP